MEEQIIKKDNLTDPEEKNQKEKSGGGGLFFYSGNSTWNNKDVPVSLDGGTQT